MREETASAVDASSSGGGSIDERGQSRGREKGFWLNLVEKNRMRKDKKKGNKIDEMTRKQVGRKQLETDR